MFGLLPAALDGGQRLVDLVAHVGNAVPRSTQADCFEPKRDGQKCATAESVHQPEMEAAIIAMLADQVVEDEIVSGDLMRSPEGLKLIYGSLGFRCVAVGPDEIEQAAGDQSVVVTADLYEQAFAEVGLHPAVIAGDTGPDNVGLGSFEPLGSLPFPRVFVEIVDSFAESAMPGRGAEKVFRSLIRQR